MTRQQHCSLPLTPALYSLLCLLLSINAAAASSLPCYVQCTSWLDTTPHTVTIGVYLTSITELSPQANTYFAAGYYWLSWPTCARIGGQPLSPWSTVHLENVAQDWTYTRSAETSCSGDRFSSPPLLTHLTDTALAALVNVSADEGDGVCPRCNTPSSLHSYVSFRFSAMLSTSFYYTRYPVDTQSLELSFEDSYYNASYMTLALDVLQSGLHERVVIPGFTIVHVTGVDGVATYNTQYGTLTTTTTTAATATTSHSPPTHFSQVQLRVAVQRKLLFFTMKVLPPTLIVLATSVVMLSLDPTRLDARLSLSTAALLAEIFLASGFESSVLDSGVMSVDDWLFNWVYVVILAVLVECVAVHRWLVRIDELQFDESLRSSIQSAQAGSVEMYEKRSERWNRVDDVEEGDNEVEREVDEDDERFHPASNVTEQRSRRSRQQQNSRRRGDGGRESSEDEIAHEAMLMFVRQRRQYAKWVDEKFAWCAIVASSLGSLLVILIAAYA